MSRVNFIRFKQEFFRALTGFSNSSSRGLIDHLIHADRLRQAVLEKVQTNQLQIISHVEDKLIQRLREKEAMVENINKKNMELKMQVEELAMKADTWQQQAKYNENMINTLKYNLQQVEVDDTASWCNGRAIDFHLLCKGINGAMTSKVCQVNEVCMLLLPCKHLCLFKECESKLSMCLLCQCSKYIFMERAGLQLKRDDLDQLT
ncbi:putative E3 ubiquitin-protein ligase BOI [Helianthus anomalus]